MNKAVKIKIYKTMVKPVAGYMGKENIKDTRTTGRERNMENRNYQELRELLYEKI
jgi:hypothetical protein